MKTLPSLVFLLGAGIACMATAQTTWTGALDGDWNKPGNWNNGVPDNNDAFLGAGVTAATSANVPDFLRLNLQNTTGKLTIGHAMTATRLDDIHESGVGNGTGGNLEILTGGSLTLTGGGPGALLEMQGFSERSTITIDGGSLTTTDELVQFNLGRGAAASEGATFTLESGTVDIAGSVFLGNSSNSSQSTIDLNGGSFSYARSFVISGNSSSFGVAGGGQLNIDGTAFEGTGTARVFNIGAGAQSGEYGRVTLDSGSLALGTDTNMTVGPLGSNIAPPSQGQLIINGGAFSAPGEGTMVLIYSSNGSPTSTFDGLPLASHGGLNQSGGTASVEGELRIGRGLPTSSTGGVGVHVHRGGELTVVNGSETGLLRVALKSQLTITGGTITADQIEIDAADGSTPGGFLQGRNGTLIGPVGVAGILSPGLQATIPENTATGTLNLHGDLTLAATATSFFDFKGTTLAAGTYDSILNDGSDDVQFGGTLTLRFFGGEYQPGSVAIFDNFASYSGDFTSVTVTGLTHGETATFNPADGTVTITAPPFDFALWRSDRGYTNPDPADDPDGFGLPNLIRYALNLPDDPVEAFPTFSHEHFVDGRIRRFDLNYQKRIGLTDATVEVRASRDLVTWLPLSDFDGSDTQTGTDGPETELRRARVFVQGENLLFLRVGATLAP